MKTAYRRVLDEYVAIWRDELGAALPGQDLHVDDGAVDRLDRRDHRAQSARLEAKFAADLAAHGDDA